MRRANTARFVVMGVVVLMALMVSGGAVVAAPVDTTARLIFDVCPSSPLPTGTFDTEMLAMDLAGGSPLGTVMVRESPSRASTGRTSITDIGGGNYHIDSFFDVFTELSLGGGIGSFDTEMLQLNISSGPGPVMIRESPTLPSRGRTSITDLGGGTYHIDSFFDIFTELSLDGGATWTPSSGAGRLGIPDVPLPSAAWAGGVGLAGLLLRRAGRRA